MNSIGVKKNFMTPKCVKNAFNMSKRHNFVLSIVYFRKIEPLHNFEFFKFLLKMPFFRLLFLFQTLIKSREVVNFMKKIFL